MRPPVLRQQVLSVLKDNGELTAEEVRRRLQLLNPPVTTLAVLSREGVLKKRWDPSSAIPRRLYRLKEESHA